MTDSTTDTLIIRHIADLDTAARLMEERIEPMLRRTCEEIVRKWAKGEQWLSGCDHDASWEDDDYPFVYPADWQRKPDTGEEIPQDAWFQLGEIDKKQDAIGGSSYWVAQLLASAAPS